MTYVPSAESLILLQKISHETETKDRHNKLLLFFPPLQLPEKTLYNSTTKGTVFVA
jgi:hypothetical protein